MTAAHSALRRIRGTLTVPSPRAAVVPVLLLALPVLAAEPQLVRVTLSSGGVGQYEFAALLDGPGSVSLDVPTSEVDDLLASLRVDDPAGGAATIRLPGRLPVAEAFRTLPISQAALASPDALLQALVGAEVTLPGAALAGTILSVNATEARLPDTTVITRHLLTLATAAGIASVVLEDQPEVRLASAPLRDQLAQGLAAIASHRAQDRRMLQVDLLAGGVREVHFGYVVPAPVWKVSYRLTLPATGSARLQGYAVLENLSGQDWHGVDVILTSGEPVLFHQPLYEAVFVERPEAPVQTGAHAVPQTDEGAQDISRAKAADGAPMPPMAPMRKFARELAAVSSPSPSASVPQETSAVSEQAATQVEFHITAPVDAAAGQSLLLPILDRAMPSKRVALVSPEAGLHPFVALDITNAAPAALPPGLVTLYGESSGVRFVGDAVLPAMQPGEDRLLSFASDLAVRVTKTDAGDSAIVSARASRGTLLLTWRDLNTTTYHVTTAPGEARSVLIEQPIREGWTLMRPAGAGRTPTRWRIAQDVAAGATQDIPVVTEHTRGQSMLVGSLSPALLGQYAGNGALSPAARTSLAKIASMRADLERRRDALAALQHRIAVIVADQERVCADLTATVRDQALQKRYAALLGSQEDDLAAGRAQEASAQASFDAQQSDFDAALMAIDF